MLPTLLFLVSCKKKDNGLRYELNLNNTYTAILDSNATVKKVSVPNKHDGKKVTELSGFRNNAYIEEVTFTKNITRIEDGSFMFCEHLKKISVSDSDYFASFNGSLYQGNNLLIYASGRSDDVVEISKNIKSKAFTIAPNIKEISINSKEVEENAIYFLENLTLIYLGENVETLSNNFQLGNTKLERLIINNTKITENLDFDNVKKVYVLENATLSDAFLENYEYKNNDYYKNISYKVYEVKK